MNSPAKERTAMMFMHALAPMLALLGVLVSLLAEVPAANAEERDGLSHMTEPMGSASRDPSGPPQ
jgi:hypothetical protein